MDSLSRLYASPNEQPSATKFNELVTEVARRLPIFGPVPLSKPIFNHPYKVAATLDPGDANTDGRTWRISTVCGCVNDKAVAIVYRSAGDPRGWTAPATVDPLKTLIVDRELWQADDPPYLSLKTPAVGKAPTSADDFQAVSDSARPSFFRTEEMWTKLLFQAHVVVTSEPKAAESPSLPAIILSRLPNRYRLVGGKMPVAPVAQAGGQMEVARLYLLRDPDAQDAFADAIMVRQMVFWDLANAYVQPANPLGDISYAGAYGEIWEMQIDQTLQDAATAQWWTV